MENKVTISIEEYKALIEAAAKLNEIRKAYLTMESFQLDYVLELLLGMKEENNAE